MRKKRLLSFVVIGLLSVVWSVVPLRLAAAQVPFQLPDIPANRARGVVGCWQHRTHIECPDGRRIEQPAESAGGAIPMTLAAAGIGAVLGGAVTLGNPAGILAGAAIGLAIGLVVDLTMGVPEQ